MSEAKKIEVVEVARSPKVETVPYTTYAKMKKERNAWKAEAEEAWGYLNNLTLWQRVKFVINGGR